MIEAVYIIEESSVRDNGGFPFTFATEAEYAAFETGIERGASHYGGNGAFAFRREDCEPTTAARKMRITDGELQLLRQYFAAKPSTPSQQKETPEPTTWITDDQVRHLMARMAEVRRKDDVRG